MKVEQELGTACAHDNAVVEMQGGKCRVEKCRVENAGRKMQGGKSRGVENAGWKTDPIVWEAGIHVSPLGCQRHKQLR